MGNICEIFVIFHFNPIISPIVQRIGSMTTTANVYGANVSDAPTVSGQFSRVAVTKSFYNDQSLETASSNDYLNM